MSGNIQDWVEYIKSRVRLQDVLKHYGVEMSFPNSEISQYKCHFHGRGSDNKPSARVYENGTGYCWGCGQAYDAISWVRKQTGRTFVDTLRLIEREFNLEPFKFEYKGDVDPEKALLDAVESIDKVFTSGKVIDPIEKWNSINSLIVRNKKELGLDRFVKFCIVLDNILHDIDKHKMEDSRAIELLEEIKVKVFARISDGN